MHLNSGKTRFWTSFHLRYIREGYNSKQMPRIQKSIARQLRTVLIILLQTPTLFADAVLPLRWDQLRKFNIEKHLMPPELSVFNGKQIEILGFIIPFEDGKDAAAEFLLVPTSQACIHVPPPPANQIIWVRMKQGTSIPLKIKPLYVSGKFHIMTNDSPVGKVGYYLEGDRVSDTSLLKSSKP